MFVYGGKYSFKWPKNSSNKLKKENSRNSVSPFVQFSIASLTFHPVRPDIFNLPFQQQQQQQHLQLQSNLFSHFELVSQGFLQSIFSSRICSDSSFNLLARKKNIFAQRITVEHILIETYLCRWLNWEQNPCDNQMQLDP